MCSYVKNLLQRMQKSLVLPLPSLLGWIKYCFLSASMTLIADGKSVDGTFVDTADGLRAAGSMMPPKLLAAVCRRTDAWRAASWAMRASRFSSSAFFVCFVNVLICPCSWRRWWPMGLVPCITQRRHRPLVIWPWPCAVAFDLALALALVAFMIRPSITRSR